MKLMKPSSTPQSLKPELVSYNGKKILVRSGKVIDFYMTTHLGRQLLEATTRLERFCLELRHSEWTPALQKSTKLEVHIDDARLVQDDVIFWTAFYIRHNGFIIYEAEFAFNLQRRSAFPVKATTPAGVEHFKRSWPAFQEHVTKVVQGLVREVANGRARKT